MTSALDALKAFYGRLPSPPADPFQFVVWEILGEKTLPARRDLAFHALQQVPALTPDALWLTSKPALQHAVALAGPRRDEKADRLRSTAGEFRRGGAALSSPALGSGLLQAARSLRRLTQVDDTIRTRALLFAAGHRVLPVDDDMARVIDRLAGRETTAAERLAPPRERARRARRRGRRWLAPQLPGTIEAYRAAAVYFRHHGQHTCVPAGPHCGVCPLRPGCRWAASRLS